VAETRQSYGSPRIHKALKDSGFSCGENRIARLMQRHEIKAKGNYSGGGAREGMTFYRSL